SLMACTIISPAQFGIPAAFFGFVIPWVVGGSLAPPAVFAPPFVIVIVAAPYYRRFAGNPQVKAFVQGVTAAAVGAITGAVVILARRSLIDWVTVAIALAALAAQLKLRKVPEPILILLAGIIGLTVHHSGS